MPNHGYVAANMCADRLKLSEAVTKAVQASYAAKVAQEEAVKSKQDVTPFVLAVAVARKAERDAVKALNEHRKEHRC